MPARKTLSRANSAAGSLPLFLKKWVIKTQHRDAGNAYAFPEPREIQGCQEVVQYWSGCSGTEKVGSPVHCAGVCRQSIKDFYGLRLEKVLGVFWLRMEALAANFHTLSSLRGNRARRRHGARANHLSQSFSAYPDPSSRSCWELLPSTSSNCQ